MQYDEDWPLWKREWYLASLEDFAQSEFFSGDSYEIWSRFGWNPGHLIIEGNPYLVVE